MEKAPVPRVNIAVAVVYAGLHNVLNCEWGIPDDNGATKSENEIWKITQSVRLPEPAG